MDTGIIVVFAGKYLADNGYDIISDLDLQRYICNSDSVGYNIPLPECRNALNCLHMGGFIELIYDENNKKIYTYKGGKPIKETENKMFSVEEIGKPLPLYSQGLGLFS